MSRGQEGRCTSSERCASSPASALAGSVINFRARFSPGIVSLFPRYSRGVISSLSDVAFSTAVTTYSLGEIYVRNSNHLPPCLSLSGSGLRAQLFSKRQVIVMQSHRAASSGEEKIRRSFISLSRRESRFGKRICVALATDGVLSKISLRCPKRSPVCA